jgi:hypothetical protein
MNYVTYILLVGGKKNTVIMHQVTLIEFYRVNSLLFVWLSVSRTVSIMFDLILDQSNVNDLIGKVWLKYV